MKFSNLKLFGALLASLSLVCTAPAWSADTAKKPVKSVAKHKYKSKHKAQHKVKSNRVPAAAVAVPMVAATMAAPMVAAAVTTPVVAAPVVVPATTAAETVNQTGYAPAAPSGNPYLAYQQQAAVPPANPWQNSGNLLSGLKSLLPNLPGTDGRSILPSIKKVYPTGEKPLVVLTFNCPTELIGISSPPIKALHGLVNLGFDALNATNLLSFNLQQVCQ